jgi:hypothetical protein
MLTKVYYQIISEDIGTVVLKRRKIAKALRWWLRENRMTFEYKFYLKEVL